MDSMDTVAENCGGSAALEARVCAGNASHQGLSFPPGQAICTHPALIDVGQVVPIAIKIKNEANYEDADGHRVEVPAKLKAGTVVQVVFSCLDATGGGCKTAEGDALEYTGKFNGIRSSTTKLAELL